MSKMNAEKKLVSRKLSSIAFLGVVICSATAVAQAGDLKFQSELEALHQKWFAAYDKGDGTTMDSVEVANLVLIFQDGSEWRKSGPRGSNQKPKDATSRELRHVVVRQFGDSAVLTGRLLSKFGSEVREDATTVVFERQNNRWLIASAHWSQVSKQK